MNLAQLQREREREREKRQKDLGETKGKLIRLVKLIKGNEK